LFLFCLMLTISHTPVKCGLFSFIGGWFGDVVDGATKGMFDRAGDLIDQAKRAFQESMDKLFDQKLTPMINQIDAMIHRNLGQIDDIIQKSIDNFKNSTLEIINTAAAQAKDLIGHTIEDIKTKIIDNAFQKAADLEGKVMNDIIQILNRLDETIYKLSCSAQSIEIRVRDDLMKTLSIIPNPFDSCRISVDNLFPGHNLRWKPLSWYQPNELYELRKCYTLSALDEKTSVQSILMAYRDMEFLAAEMRCLSIAFAATMNLKYYIKEMGEIAHVIDVYESQVSFSGASLSHDAITENEGIRFLMERRPIIP